ncbi:hypothetical protein Q8A73_016780 [Channa argus]|nr:hypothetical protein Q8A73_016780 [Channa argus]
MADAKQLLEQMFSWLEQRESCAQQLREAASRIEVGMTTCAAAGSTQSSLPSNIMNDTHDPDGKRKEILEIIQQLFQLLFEQLKAEIVGGAVGSVFAHPELYEHWKNLIEKNNEDVGGDG